jgi:predicted nucleic acid-binding Zn ribbon protein
MMNQRNFNRGRTISGLGSIIDGALRQNALAEGLRPHRALALWSDVVGDTLAQASTAETVRGGVLFVRARSGVWAHELTLLRGEILQRLNSKLGGSVISDIHFKAGGRRPKAMNSITQRSLPIAPTETDLGVSSLDLEPIPSDPKAAMMQRVRAIRERAARTLAWKRENGWIPCAKCKALFEPTFADQRHRKATAGLCPLCSLNARQKMA